eukprot:115419_1
MIYLTLLLSTVSSSLSKQPHHQRYIKVIVDDNIFNRCRLTQQLPYSDYIYMLIYFCCRYVYVFIYFILFYSIIGYLWQIFLENSVWLFMEDISGKFYILYLSLSYIDFT